MVKWYERWEEFKDDETDVKTFFGLHDFLLNEEQASLRSYFHYFHLSLIPKEIRKSKKKVYCKNTRFSKI